MNNLTKIPYLLVRFQNEIAPYEVPAFRGAVITQVPKELVLFHNHTDDGFRYRYPLIQYKRIHGKAAIFCIGKGTEEIGAFFSSTSLTLDIGTRKEALATDVIFANNWILQPWKSTFTYSLRKWLPFNQDNYNKYKQYDGLSEKVEILEHILVGNILSLCTGVGYHVEEQVTCKIFKISNERLYTHKGVKIQGMDVVFQTNVYLPNYIALGKAVSHGFGIITEIKEKQDKHE